MGYQLSAAPLHAAGVPGAWAVLGAAFWGTLVWLGAVRAHLAGHRAWTGLVVAGLVASFYPTIWYATSGAHGMGDATFAGAVLLALVGQGTGRQRLAPVVILLVAAASTKVTLLPMILVVWVSVSAHAWRISPREARGELAVMAIVPWLIWQGLPLGWTWMHSGSPWGPIFANVLGESVYDVPALQKMLASGWASGRYDLPRMALFALGFLNPVLWLGLAWAVVRSLVNREHLLLPGLVALQVGLMTFAVPLDARYLGGLQFVGLLTLAAHPPTRILSALARPVGIAVATLLTVPWALLGAAEAADAARVATGQLTANSYCEDALPLYESFGDLDAALPPDAALLALRNVGGTKLPNAYAPRPIAMMPEDLPPDRRPFLLWVGPNDRDAIERAVTRRTPYRLGPPMFEPRTVEWSTRGRRPGRATVGVYALESATEPPTGSAARPPQ